MSKVPVILLVVAGVIGSMMIAVSVPLSYGWAALLFSLVAFASAPVVLHKVADKGVAIGFLIGLAIYGSVPIMRYFEIDGFIFETLITLAYTALLFAIGSGWKRNWT